MSQYDLIVIGSGPAGAKGAEEAARLGKKVALVEKAHRLGGAGINTGTVPSKTLRETAQYMAGLKQRSVYGLNVTMQAGLTLGDLMYRRPAVLEAEWGLIRRNLDRYRIEIVRGEATLLDPYTVRVHTGDATRDITATRLLLASGSSAYRPPQLSFDDPRVFDASSLPDLQALPKRLVVVGGGVIGSEYAAIFNALGVQVTLVERQPRLLPMLDAELADRFKRQMEENGVTIILNEPVVAVEAEPAQLNFRLNNGEALPCDMALVATGRVGNTQGLGLESAGVAVDELGFILVNEFMQTNQPSVYAAGDVATRNSWASMSMEQGRSAVRHAFGQPVTRAGLVPLAAYGIPEIAMVGLTEEQCKAQGEPYLIGRAYGDQNPRGQIIGEATGLLKILFSPKDLSILGVHMLGENACELIHIGQSVMLLGGKLDAFTQLVYNYPSLSEMYAQAALNGLEHWERWKTMNGNQ